VNLQPPLAGTTIQAPVEAVKAKGHILDVHPSNETAQTGSVVAFVLESSSSMLDIKRVNPRLHEIGEKYLSFLLLGPAIYSNPEAILSPQKRDVLFKHCFGIQEGGGDSKLTCLGFKFYPIGMRNSERQV
jgi:hypothetical protein